jgi:D-beta-D-heptose 7-phosphate kinase/D-beta-D-heptose 1-phosphate adenosyltransferase
VTKRLDFGGLRVLVVGDIMLDEFVLGRVERISPEAPAPVFVEEEKNFKLGGAGNVAANIKALGANVKIISIVGEDDSAAEIVKLLAKSQIPNKLIVDNSSVTTRKSRFIAKGQQVLRVDSDNLKYDSLIINSLNETIENELEEFDILIISDYLKGVIEQPEVLISLAKKHHAFISVDSKNVNLNRFAGANLITPNFVEFTNAFRLQIESGLTEEQIVQNFLEVNKVSNLFLTKSESGIAAYTTREVFSQEAVRVEVSDVTGAGDTLLATATLALFSKYDLKTSVTLSNLAAGKVVSEHQTSSISIEQLNVLFWRLKDKSKSFATNTECFEVLESLRIESKTIGFTNGCFDVIHAGHVKLLNETKKLVDFLVVGLNSDESVRALKGSTRPINSQSNRASVLEALEAVDMVIIFNELTPEFLIHQVRPDILTKGGDYKLSEIVGANFVVENQGKVVLIDYLPGHSTSAIIDAGSN